MILLRVVDIGIACNAKDLHESFPITFSFLHQSYDIPRHTVLTFYGHLLVMTSLVIKLLFIYHPLVGCNNLCFFLHAGRGYQYAESSGDDEAKYREHDHAEEVFRLRMHLFRILWSHALTLKSLDSIFDRFAIDNFNRLLRRTHHSVHIRTLHQEKYRCNDIQHQNELQSASISHQNSSLVFSIVEQFVKQLVTFLLLFIILVNGHEIVAQVFHLDIVSFWDRIHL